MNKHNFNIYTLFHTGVTIFLMAVGLLMVKYFDYTYFEFIAAVLFSVAYYYFNVVRLIVHNVSKDIKELNRQVKDLTGKVNGWYK